MSEEKFACSKCGAFVSKEDKVCGSCGASLVEASVPVVPEQKVNQPYVRRFSSVQRLYKLFVSPREAMEDIALAPDYAGVGIIVALEAVLVVFSLVMAFQKVSFVGDYAGTIISITSLVLAFGVVLSVGLFVVRWFVKSLLVKYVCESGSFWSFRTAVSVTGYAYVVSVVLSVVSIFVGWFLIAPLTVDTSNFEGAMMSIGEFRAQAGWVMFVYGLPVSFVGLVWKSYLGGLGAHFGTKRKFSVSMGVMWFLIIGLIGLLVSFLSAIW